MNPILFAFIFLGTAMIMILLPVGSYFYSKYALNKYLINILRIQGYSVVTVKSTTFKFDVKTKSNKKGLSFGTGLVDYGGSGSGLHFREVIVEDENHGEKMIYVAVEMERFYPIEVHIF